MQRLETYLVLQCLKARAQEVQLRSCQDYPYAFAPRLGVAYQLSPKTVLRGGIGVVYSATNIGGVGTALGLADASVTLGAGTAGVNQPVTTLSAGNPLESRLAELRSV